MGRSSRSDEWAAIMPSAGIAFSNPPTFFLLPVLAAFAIARVRKEAFKTRRKE